MKYFVVSDLSKNVAVIFYDNVNKTIHCRSITQSFSSIFDAVLNTNVCSFARKGNNLKVSVLDKYGYGQVKNILNHICGDHWSLGDDGEILNSGENIEEVIEKYLI